VAAEFTLFCHHKEQDDSSAILVALFVGIQLSAYGALDFGLACPLMRVSL
jgi:hypothetical protein